MMSSSQTDDPKTPLKDISTNGTTNYEIKESEKEEMIDVGEPKLSIELQTVSNKNTMDNNNDTTLVVNNSPMASSPMASSPIPANTPHSISMPDIPIPSNPTSFNDDTGYLKVQTKISTDGIGINAPSSFLMSQRNSTSYTKPLNDGMINQGTLRVNTNSTMNNPHPQDTMRSVTGLDSMYYQPTFRHAPTIRDELLLPPKDKEPDDINFEIAITYLRDALKIRPPQRRIQDLLGATFKPLSAYKLMKSFFWSHFIYTLIWCNMLLTVWEPPQDTIPGNKDWNKNRVTILVIYQLIFIFFYSLDICLKFYSHDKREIGQWTYIISLVLFYDFIISIITFFFYDIQEIENLYRSSRIIRPFFLFYKSRDLKKLARSILRGIPSLFEVGALIVLFLLLFSFAAYYLFNESEWLGVNPSFETFQESVYSLMVLQTTANFPDVMMPSYDKSEWTAVFFFIYNVLGIYFLMALVLAVIYNNYSDHILRDVERIKLVRERAINATFKVLTWHQNHPDKHLIDNHRTKNSKNKHSHKKLPKSKKRKQKYKKVIYLSTFKRIMKRMRKDLYSTFNNNAEAVDEQIQWMYLAMANATEPDYDDGIDKKQFSQIANYIELEITKDIAKAKRLSVLKKTQKFQTRRNLLLLEHEQKGNRKNASSTNLLKTVKSVPIWWYQFRLKLISFWQWKKEIKCCKQKTNDRFRGHAHRVSMTIDSMIRRSIINSTNREQNGYMSHQDSTPSSPRIPYKKHSTWSEDVISECTSFTVSTEYFVNLLVMFSTVFVILDVYHLSSKIQWMADIIIYLFLFEVVFKMIAFGIRGYLNDTFNKLDFILSLVAFVFEELLENTIKVIIIFRIIRLLRLLRAFTRFRVILRTTKAVLSSFRSLFILEFCIAYMYAILGMELFDGLINKEIVENLCEEQAADTDSNLVVPFWCNMYDTKYYANNFNSFTHAIVVQMELIVVNNWHIITDMYVKRTSPYARFYFVSVYFSAVVVVMNVLTAFVLEAFISQYENNENEINKIMNASNMQNKADNENDDDHDPFNGKNLVDLVKEDVPENEIEARMHNVIRMFRSEEEVGIYHYNRKLSKALFYEQLYPQLFKQPEEEKSMILTNDTTRSLNTIYSQYNTTRSHNHLLIHGPVDVHAVNGANTNGNISDYEPRRISSHQQLLQSKSPTIEEEEDEKEQVKVEKKNKDAQITPIGGHNKLIPMPVIKSENELEFVDYDPSIETEILNENKSNTKKEEEKEHANDKENDSMNDEDDESEIKSNDVKIGLNLHGMTNSNTMVFTPDSDETLKVSSNGGHTNMQSETISMQNFNIATPKFYGHDSLNNNDIHNGNRGNSNDHHQMDFSMDSLTNIAPIHGTDAMIPTLATPHSQSQSAVHANYFDTAPTASTLIAANRNKYHFITLPSNINQKTSIKSGNQLISSSASKMNNVKIKQRTNHNNDDSIID